MISKNTIKFINSLRIKKFRNQEGLFIAEGERLVDELVNSSLELRAIYHTANWIPPIVKGDSEISQISDEEMKKISGLSAPSAVLSLVKIPEFNISEIDIKNSLTLALDSIQDPGNLGTIIRLADWFGIDTIICTNETVDAFAPKVIQSCMGSISRVKVIYCNLESTLKDLKAKYKLPVYGTFMEGYNIYKTDLSAKGVIVMGNEGNGISKNIEQIVSQKIHIPTFAEDRGAVESLNVAMATAIVFSEFKRKNSII